MQAICNHLHLQNSHLYASPVPDQELYRSEAGGHEVVLVREEDGTLGLTIDGYWQFTSVEEHLFHEVLADAPMILAPAVPRVLILGGGDGLALRNVLRYREVERVTLVDVDPAVLELARTVPEMCALNERAFEDPRVEVVTADALTWIERETDDTAGGQPYDVVICDFPAPATEDLQPLFAEPFYERLARRCQPDAVVAVQVSQDLPEFWNTLRSVSAVFPWTAPLLLELVARPEDDEAWADFIVASRAERAPQRTPASDAAWLDAARLEAITIRNRSGPRFETEAYGTRPVFDSGF